MSKHHLHLVDTLKLSSIPVILATAISLVNLFFILGNDVITLKEFLIFDFAYVIPHIGSKSEV